MADENGARTGKVGVNSLGAWVALPPTQSGRGLIAMVLAAAAAADTIFALFLLTRS
jgi:hypothetical protein